MSDKIVPIEEHIKDIQEITIAIDTWDDIFSDFDPSPLAQRILSEDFLLELKKRYRETPRGSYVITIYAPVFLKDDASQAIVIKRLKQYFKLRHLAIEKEINGSIRKGFIFIAVGTVILGFLILLAYFQLVSQLGIELLGIVLMPLGWFGIWEGFSHIIDPPPLLKQDLEVFGKLAKATFKFKYAGQGYSESSLFGSSKNSD